jgi:hypothetical protein
LSGARDALRHGLSRLWHVEHCSMLLPAYSLAAIPVEGMLSTYTFRKAFITGLVRACIYGLCTAEDGRCFVVVVGVCLFLNCLIVVVR